MNFAKCCRSLSSNRIFKETKKNNLDIFFHINVCRQRDICDLENVRASVKFVRKQPFEITISTESKCIFYAIFS